MKEFIIVVDDKDNRVGLGEKLEVHKKGILHRAFSIFIFNNGNLLIQKRQRGKYHSEGLWSNTCCSHQRANEELLSAAKNRLNEEMGFTCDLEEVFSFRYKVYFENGLIENELDHVFIGYYNGQVSINLEEVSEYKWVNFNELKKNMKEDGTRYTYWFKYIIDNCSLEKYIR